MSKIIALPPSDNFRRDVIEKCSSQYLCVYCVYIFCVICQISLFVESFDNFLLLLIKITFK